MKCPECGREMTKESRSGSGKRGKPKTYVLYGCENISCSVIGVKLRYECARGEPIEKRVLYDTIKVKERNNIAMSRLQV